MPSDLRPIHAGNLEDLLHVIRGSSHGHIFQLDLDIFGFLALSRFWNFSYQHSFLNYVSGQPAGALLNCADPEEHQAYTFYWGVLPEFRRGRVAMSLIHAFKLLRDQGYLTIEADETVESPSTIYKKLGYLPTQSFAELQTGKIDIASVNDQIELHEIDVDRLLADWPLFPGFRHWAQRPNFMRNSVKFVEFLAAFTNETMSGYIVVTRLSGHSVISDLRFQNREAGLALLRRISGADFPPPYSASFVPVPSSAYQLLIDVGFVSVKRFTSVTLEFSSSSSQFLRRSTT